MANDAFIDISIEEKEFVDMLSAMEDMHDCITPRWIKNTQSRYARPMVADMKASSHSISLVPMIGVTTAKKRAGDLGIKVGVVKNDANSFPNLTAQALASVIEYGTAERYRTLKALGFLVTGRQSTGEMPAAPWLRPAWDRNVKALMDGVEQAIEKKVMKEA